MPTQRRTAKSARKPSAKSSSRAAAGSTKRSGSKSPAGAGRVGSRKRASSSGSASSSRSGRGNAAKRGALKGSSRSRRAPDALELLTQDHRNVQKMFRKAQRLEAGDPQLEQIIATACAALTEHAGIEESVFYPALREQGDAQDMLDEAEVEHDVAKELIAQLQGASGADERVKAMFKVLGEYVNHHIEEEEGEMFRAAKRAKLDLAALGEQILAAKQGAEYAEGVDTGRGEGERGARRDAGDGDGDGSRAHGAGDEETPGGRSGGSREASRPTSH